MKTFRLVAINVLIFFALLAGLELFFRAKGPSANAAIEQPNGMQLHVLPYVMFANEARSRYSTWQNIFSGQNVTADIRVNNAGYNDPHDFDWRKPYAKAANEKVVLFVGGSTAWGVGSTSFATTIAGSLQTELARIQSTTKYMVVNLGMGSWIAYQQFIGLEMWGSQFDPDWVIIMDGHNDAGVGCGYSQGPMNPLYFPVIKNLVDAYSATGVNRPVYLRGWLENEIIHHSAAYRALTGKRYIPASELDPTNQDQTRGELRKIILPTKLSAAREMLDFYVKATKASLSLFPRAKYILSTQPMVNDFTGDFVDVYKTSQEAADPAAMAKRENDLEAYLRANENKTCNTETYIPSFTYVYVKGAFELEKLAAQERATGRFVEYHNIGRVFPNARAERLKYFIDAAHVSDEGAREIGKFYAARILRADKPAD
jgi:hypothetical protein